MPWFWSQQQTSTGILGLRRSLSRYHLEKIMYLLSSVARCWQPAEALGILPAHYLYAVLSHSVTSDSKTLWIVAHQAPLWGFSRPEYWSGLPCPPPEDLPNPAIESKSLALQAGSLPSELPGKSKNTGVGSHSLLQGILLTLELNRGLLHYKQIFLPAELPRKPYNSLSQPFCISSFIWPDFHLIIKY